MPDLVLCKFTWEEPCVSLEFYMYNAYTVLLLKTISAKGKYHKDCIIEKGWQYSFYGAQK